MICPKCNCPSPDGSSFCIVCGNVFSSTDTKPQQQEKPQTQPVAPVPSVATPVQPVQPTITPVSSPTPTVYVPQQSNVSASKPKKKNNFLIPLLIGLGVLLLIIIAILILAFIGGDSDNDSDIYNEPFYDTFYGEGTESTSNYSDETEHSIYLEATDDEIDELDSFIYFSTNLSAQAFTNYDCNVMTFFEFYQSYFVYASGEAHLYYGDVENYHYNDTPDPYGWFAPQEYDDWYTGYYYVYPVEDVIWMMTNIYNISIDTAYVPYEFETEDSYLYDGYIYQGYHTGFGDSGYEIVVEDVTRLSDGRYSVYYSNYNYYTEEYTEYATAIVSLKEIDGERYWTLHSIEVE